MTKCDRCDHVPTAGRLAGWRCHCGGTYHTEGSTCVLAAMREAPGKWTVEVGPLLAGRIRLKVPKIKLRPGQTLLAHRSYDAQDYEATVHDVEFCPITWAAFKFDRDAEHLYADPGFFQNVMDRVPGLDPETAGKIVRAADEDFYEGAQDLEHLRNLMLDAAGLREGATA